MRKKDIILKGTRKVFRKLTGKQFLPSASLSRVECNNSILELLNKDEPCMVSRFGSGEIGIIVNYMAIHDDTKLFRKCLRYVTDEYGLPWWDDLWYKSMQNNMGIFPKSINILERFANRYLEDVPEIDLLGSMNYVEKFMPLSEKCRKFHIECLYPFFVDTPWTKGLEGKKVLVIHPFVISIKEQYSKRSLIFENSDLWPNYELKLFRAVQSNAGAKVPYSDWFEALEYMEDEIGKMDFDVAILGCGAYGLPLAAFIKRMGKKAIHLGGGSQLLFGIKGRRWEEDYKYSYLPDDFDTDYRKLFNEFWIRPHKEETPQGAQNVEGGCYW